MSGINSFIFSTSSALIIQKRDMHFGVFAHTPIFAQPPLSPDLAPNKLSQRYCYRVSHLMERGGTFRTGCF